MSETHSLRAMVDRAMPDLDRLWQENIRYRFALELIVKLAGVADYREQASLMLTTARQALNPTGDGDE